MTRTLKRGGSRAFFERKKQAVASAMADAGMSAKQTRAWNEAPEENAKR